MAISGNPRGGNFSTAIINKVIPGKAILGNYMQCNSRNGYFRQYKVKQFQRWQLHPNPAMAIQGYSRQGNFRQSDSILKNSRQEILGKAFQQLQPRQFQPVGGKAIQGKEVTSMARQSKARRGNFRKGSSRQGKAIPG